MTVKELCNELKRLMMEGHGDLEVMTEGCDCIGSSASVELGEGYGNAKVVFINRYDE